MAYNLPLREHLSKLVSTKLKRQNNLSSNIQISVRDLGSILKLYFRQLNIAQNKSKKQELKRR